MIKTISEYLEAAINNSLELALEGQQWHEMTNPLEWKMGEVVDLMERGCLRIKPETITLYEYILHGEKVWDWQKASPEERLAELTGRVIRNAVIEEGE